MSDRPDDIPQDAWDAATEVSYLLWAPKSRANYYTINIARAIDQARREGYAAGVREAAEVAETGGAVRDWVPNSLYDTMRKETAAQIRALDGKGDGA